MNAIGRFGLRILDAMQTGHEIVFIFFPGGITVMPSMSRFRILLKDGCPSFWWSLGLVSVASLCRGSNLSVWLSARYCLSISVDAFRAVVGIQYTLLVAAAGGSRWICERPVVGHSENGTKCLCALSICMPYWSHSIMLIVARIADSVLSLVL